MLAGTLVVFAMGALGGCDDTKTEAGVTLGALKVVKEVAPAAAPAAAPAEFEPWIITLSDKVAPDSINPKTVFITVDGKPHPSQATVEGNQLVVRIDTPMTPSSDRQLHIEGVKTPDGRKLDNFLASMGAEARW